MSEDLCLLPRVAQLTVYLTNGISCAAEFLTAHVREFLATLRLENWETHWLYGSSISSWAGMRPLPREITKIKNTNTNSHTIQGKWTLVCRVKGIQVSGSPLMEGVEMFHSLRRERNGIFLLQRRRVCLTFWITRKIQLVAKGNKWSLMLISHIFFLMDISLSLCYKWLYIKA